MCSYIETFLSLLHFKMRRVFLPNYVLINVPYPITVMQAAFNFPATLLPSLEMKSPWVPRTVLWPFPPSLQLLRNDQGTPANSPPSWLFKFYPYLKATRLTSPLSRNGTPRSSDQNLPVGRRYPACNSTLSKTKNRVILAELVETQRMK
jgi:hypothetical protein